MAWFGNDDKKKKEEPKSIGGIFNKAFGVDENTPQKSTVWGTCGHCHHEGWADKTLYNDSNRTTYYTCKSCGRKDKFREHQPTFDNGLRRKQADKPIRGLSGDNNWQEDRRGGSTNGRDPLRGRKKYSVVNVCCSKCGSQYANKEEDMETSHVLVRCQGCGKKLGPKEMR